MVLSSLVEVSFDVALSLPVEEAESWLWSVLLDEGALPDALSLDLPSWLLDAVESARGVSVGSLACS